MGRGACHASLSAVYLDRVSTTNFDQDLAPLTEGLDQPFARGEYRCLGTGSLVGGTCPDGIADGMTCKKFREPLPLIGT